jgi:hypothetical protein
MAKRIKTERMYEIMHNEKKREWAKEDKEERKDEEEIITNNELKVENKQDISIIWNKRKLEKEGWNKKIIGSVTE